MAKLGWRVKLIAELGSGTVSETEVARIEHDDFAVAETVGLTLDEGVVLPKMMGRLNQGKQMVPIAANLGGCRLLDNVLAGVDANAGISRYHGANTPSNGVKHLRSTSAPLHRRKPWPFSWTAAVAQP